MGNIISCMYDSFGSLYENYYPKQKWLQPRYVSATLMASSLGYNYLTKGKICCPKTANFIFLSCTGATLGLQISAFWINGLTMMKLLPRHQFGLVQSHLYPKFFFLSSLFNFASLSVFMKSYPTSWTDSKLNLGICLTASFVLNVLNMTCFNVNSVKYNRKMHEIEANSGEGLETIGPLAKDSPCESDPEYVNAKKKFYRFHGYSALAGLASFGCTLAELYFLSDKTYFNLN